MSDPTVTLAVVMLLLSAAGFLFMAFRRERR